MPLIDWIVMFTLVAVVATALAATTMPGRKRAGGTTDAPGSVEPLLAAALSLLIPGVGQALLGAWGRAAVWFAGFFLVAGVSQAVHGPLVVVVMVLAGFDAYQVARARADRPRPDASRPSDGSQGSQTSKEDSHEAT